MSLAPSEGNMVVNNHRYIEGHRPLPDINVPHTKYSIPNNLKLAVEVL